MDTIDAIKGRSSIRAFLDKPVNRKTVEQILEIARWAPSSSNIQPWQITVVTGDSKVRLSEAIIHEIENDAKPHPEVTRYPDDWFEPYKTRRFSCGMALYKSQDIGHDDTEARRQAWIRNYRFFGAPVGLLFFINRKLGPGAWMDVGMFMQNIMLVAHNQGLGTCAQASLTDYPDAIRSILGTPDEHTLICGMSLGYPDINAPVNQYRLDREDVNKIYTWND